MGTKAKWTPAQAKEPTDLPEAAVRFVDDKTLKITLVPGDPGPAILLLLTPNGFVATATVVVAAV